MIQEKFFDLALLVAICLKNEKMITFTLSSSNLEGRYEFRLKNIGNTFN
jgi:hypothetical protein